MQEVQILAMITKLMGGLALFLMGMKFMGDGLERVAGDRMRRFLEFITKSRLRGVIFGALFTMLIQSSSSTTVIVVGFVNAGLMNLLQASGVIMGANFGTSITAQLAAFNLSAVAPIILLVGVVMILFIKRGFSDKLGWVLAGFGMLFVGMDMMSQAMVPLRTNATFSNLVALLSSNAISAMLVGVVLTCIIQSSSASVVLVQLLAAQGLIALEYAIYISLGCAIGTCITAMLASIGASPTARRAAIFHLLYNVIGSVIMLVLLQFIPLAAWMRAISGGDVMREIANANMLIKLAEVLLLFGAAPLLVNLSAYFVKEEPALPENALHTRYIDDRLLATPSIAITQAVQETERMTMVATENLNRAIDAFIQKDTKAAKQVMEQEKLINYLNHEITMYLVKIGHEEKQTESDAQLVGSLYHVINDVERIGDHAENIAEYALGRVNGDVTFSDEAISELDDMRTRVIELLNRAQTCFHTRDKNELPSVQLLEDSIDDLERDLQQHHIDRVAQSKCTPQSGMVFSDMLSNLERVADHATNIAYSIVNRAENEQPKDRSELMTDGRPSQG